MLSPRPRRSYLLRCHLPLAAHMLSFLAPEPARLLPEEKSDGRRTSIDSARGIRVWAGTIIEGCESCWGAGGKEVCVCPCGEGMVEERGASGAREEGGGGVRRRAWCASECVRAGRGGAGSRKGDGRRRDKQGARDSERRTAAGLSLGCGVVRVGLLDVLADLGDERGRHARDPAGWQARSEVSVRCRRHGRAERGARR